MKVSLGGSRMRELKSNVFASLPPLIAKKFKQESILVGCIPPPLEVSLMLGTLRGGGDTQINCLHSKVLGLPNHCPCVHSCPLTPQEPPFETVTTFNYFIFIGM